jgi:hypothetical protein
VEGRPRLFFGISAIDLTIIQDILKSNRREGPRPRLLVEPNSVI